MSQPDRDLAAVLDMLIAARRIVEFRGRLTKAAFFKDAKTQSSVLHQVIVLGEACKRVSDAFRARRPSIPWREIAGMRDTVIHEYDSVDVGEVWKVAKHDVLALIPVLERLAPPPPTL